jgi:uroporphyrin-III C-methyltransferase/precorrin-2 dehydrogenase/sirohydrochlorin ferrochelatase
MHGLPVLLRCAGRPVILLGEGEAAEAKRRLLLRAGAVVTADEAAPAMFAIVALEGAEAERAAARLRARGLLVNVVDRPDLCDITIPAIVDRDPVLIAVVTGGASAGLAKALRQRIEALLPPGVGALARALAEARAGLRARWPDARDRRSAIDAALADGGLLDPLDDGAAGRVAGWLAADGGAQPGGRLVHLTLASADPDELTLRAARLLGRADALWHRGDVPETILSRARADARRHIAPAAPAVPAAGLILWLEMAA